MDEQANREKADKKVLRAEDIIPSRGTEQTSGAGTAETAEPAVPQFDLATEIMAQQRKITAARRKRQNGRPQVSLEKPKTKSSAAFAKVRPTEIQARDPIVAEIVARDIQRMLQTRSRP